MRMSNSDAILRLKLRIYCSFETWRHFTATFYMGRGEKYDFISGWHATTVRVMNHNNCHYRNALFSVIPADMSSWQIIGFDAHHTHFNILWARQNWAISQTTFWNTFSWMKIYEFRWRFPWHLFLRLELTIFPHWFRLWLGADQATSHYLNRWWLVYWRIYASLGHSSPGNYSHVTPRLIQNKVRIIWYKYIKWWSCQSWQRFETGTKGNDHSMNTKSTH